MDHRSRAGEPSLVGSIAKPACSSFDDAEEPGPSVVVKEDLYKQKPTAGPKRPVPVRRRRQYIFSAKAQLVFLSHLRRF